MPSYFYYQGHDKNEVWKAAPVAVREKVLRDTGAVFCTALSVSKLADQIEPSEKDKLSYEGPFYLDWDSKDIAVAIDKVKVVMGKFQKMGINLDAIAWYASGQKGFHAEVPQAMFLEGKLPKAGIVALPVIYKEMVLELAVDTLDLKVYSTGRGRMWRVPNVKRPDNGFYKVPVTAAEITTMTPERYAELIKEERVLIPLAQPEFNVDLHLMWANAKQKVEERLKARGTRKRDPKAKLKARAASLKLLMQGKGIKHGVGFHEIAMQVTIAAAAAGIPADVMITECEGLINSHQSDGARYGTPERRRDELLRLYDYMQDNPGYEFAVGAVKALLNHGAPDLDDLPISEEDLAAEVALADERTASGEEQELDEYADVASGVSINTWGIYVDSESGKKRICAVSFRNVFLLHSMITGVLTGYETEVLVNGKSVGRTAMELDTFSSLQNFNRWAQKYGHAMQGQEHHVRGLMMRFVEEGKKRGKVLYVTSREGLDIVNIPGHSDVKLREPFMVYAAHSGVLLDPRVRDTGLEVLFQGYPDPRGVYRTDLSDAPNLATWLDEEGNKDALRTTLGALLQMQSPDTIAKMLGWYVSCFFRMLFHKGYSKFPLMHVNGAAGSGKTEMNTTLASLFFYNQEPKVTSPTSTFFALTQQMSGSSSVPLVVDEYKPTEMVGDYHNKLKLAFRDAYNCREVIKGGGNRESDDFRVLSHTMLASPIVFIAEAAEEESAVAERIVLVTIVKPSSSMSLRQLAHFNTVKRNRQHLSILGQYLATQVIEEYSIERLREEFDPIFTEARDKYMLTDKDIAKGGLSPEALMDKQNSKERTVYNYSVVRFGLQRFRGLIESMFKGEFTELMDKLEAGVYTRMADLQVATQPEWAKVLSAMCDMSWTVDPDAPHALRRGREYALGDIGGKATIEIALKSSYFRYRQYANSTRSKILFSGDAAFLHAMKDCPAKIQYGTGESLKQPGVFTLDVQRLQEAGVLPFKDR